MAPAEKNGLSWSVALWNFGAVLLFVLLLYWKTAVSIAEIWWRSATFAHGMVIIPIVIYLLWTRRHILAQLSPTPEPLGLVLAAVVTFSWFIGHAAGLQVLQQLSLVALVPVLVLTLLGSDVVRAVAFPLAYLFFVVPVGEVLIPTLQEVTSILAVRLLEWSGIPVYWQGLQLTTPAGNFEVAKACSGVRYLIASVALGTLYAYLVYRSYWRRIVFIALAVITPIVANGVRAYGIIMLAYLNDRKVAIDVDHFIYGWIFFGIVLLVLFRLGLFFQDTKADSMPARPPGNGVTKYRKRSKSAFMMTAIFSGVVIGLGPVAAAKLKTMQGSNGSELLTLLPEAPSGWRGPMDGQDLWQPELIGATRELLGSYEHREANILLFVAHYRQQTQGKELINSENRIYNRRDWTVAWVEDNYLMLPDGTRLSVVETQLVSRGKARLVWHWFDVAGHSTAKNIVAKLLELWAVLSGNARGSFLVAVALDYEGQMQEARKQLERFLAMVYRDLERCLVVHQAMAEVCVAAGTVGDK